MGAPLRLYSCTYTLDNVPGRKCTYRELFPGINENHCSPYAVIVLSFHVLAGLIIMSEVSVGKVIESVVDVVLNPTLYAPVEVLKEGVTLM